MTVKELIEHLEGLRDQDALVVLASDGEGNNFSAIPDDPDYAMSEGFFHKDRWESEYYPPPGQDPEADEMREDLGDAAKPCVVLWPSN